MANNYNATDVYAKLKREVYAKGPIEDVYINDAANFLS